MCLCSLVTSLVGAYIVSDGVRHFCTRFKWQEIMRERTGQNFEEEELVMCLHVSDNNQAF